MIRSSALLLLGALMLAGFALADYSLDERQREYTPYALGDFAAARFAVYGLLPDVYRTPQKETAKPLSRLDAVQLLRDAFGWNTEDVMNIPFRDVDEEYREAVSWAYSNGIVKGRTATEFGTYHVTEQAFVTMLLNALGFQRKFTYGEAFPFAESVGLPRPAGLSASFSLGDALLYLQATLHMTGPGGKPMRDRMNIPPAIEEDPEWNQAAFPSGIVLYPVSFEDAEAQIEQATRYLPLWIDVSVAAMSPQDVKALREQFNGPAGNAWYLNRIQEDCLYQDSWTETELFRAGRQTMTLRFPFNEAWKLACDVDDAFSCFEDETLSREADQFYRQYVAKAKTPKDAVYRAKEAIVSHAHYAAMEGARSGPASYPRDAHSIIGFFRDGGIVCDGYAKVFQYLMHRAGVPCVVCYGSTISREDAENDETDHAWNKVQIGGKWLNMDICWADTGWGATFDLRDNEHYEQFRHWSATHTGL